MGRIVGGGRSLLTVASEKTRTGLVNLSRLPFRLSDASFTAAIFVCFGIAAFLASEGLIRLANLRDRQAQRIANNAAASPLEFGDTLPIALGGLGSNGPEFNGGLVIAFRVDNQARQRENCSELEPIVLWARRTPDVRVRFMAMRAATGECGAEMTPDTFLHQNQEGGHGPFATEGGRQDLAWAVTDSVGHVLYNSRVNPNLAKVRRVIDVFRGAEFFPHSTSDKWPRS